jgi:hypothetical protein
MSDTLIVLHTAKHKIRRVPSAMHRLVEHNSLPPKMRASVIAAQARMY